MMMDLLLFLMLRVEAQSNLLHIALLHRGIISLLDHG
jgi:hypothetical protein